jgi:hypothetical protein
MIRTTVSAASPTSGGPQRGPPAVAVAAIADQIDTGGSRVANLRVLGLHEAVQIAVRV